MDEHTRSTRLLQSIANCLDVPVEHFLQCASDIPKISNLAPVAARQNASMQAHRLLRLYWSLPDQISKDLAINMVERFAKDRATH